VLGCEGGFNQEEEEDIVLSMEIKMSLFAVKRELFIRPYLIIPCAQLSEALSLSPALFMSQFSISLGGNSLIAHLSTFKACD
jgi:hypothetical protein